MRKFDKNKNLHQGYNHIKFFKSSNSIILSTASGYSKALILLNQFTQFRNFIFMFCYGSKMYSFIKYCIDQFKKCDIYLKLLIKAIHLKFK